MQVPALPVSAHDRHVPAQAVAQQTPWAQKPELQSVPAPQVAPTGLRPQLPLVQVREGPQSASVWQAVWQVASSPQVNGAHEWLCPVAHVPRPSQRPAEVSVWPAQLGAWQVTPAGYFWQAPAPLQTPSVPQLAAPVSWQSLRGSVPRSAGEQVPNRPEAVQVWQIPAHRVAQQTPSVQKLDPHCPSSVQACPLAKWEGWASGAGALASGIWTKIGPASCPDSVCAPPPQAPTPAASQQTSKRGTCRVGAEGDKLCERSRCFTGYTRE